MEQDTRFHELMRKTSKEARFEAKHKAMSQKRIGFEHFAVEEKDYSLDIILSNCKDFKFTDITWLQRLKKNLYSGDGDPNDYFIGQDSSFNLHCLGNVISNGETSAQLLGK